MKCRLAIVLLGLGLLPGCLASSFSRRDTTVRGRLEPILITDSAVADAQVLKPQLRFPCRIAVYMRPGAGDQWRWTAKDFAAVESWATTLKTNGMASDFFVLPDMLVGRGEKEDLKDLRVAAARCGAEALLVIQGSATVSEYKNPASILNLTVVGGFIVPASHRDAQFTMEGVLFDTNNGYVYAGAKAEGEGKVVAPTFVIESRDAVSKAQARAVEKFGPEIVRRLQSLAH